MKEIHVMKNVIGGGYRPISTEELEELAKKETPLVGVTLQTENPDVMIHLYKEVLFAFFGVDPEVEGAKLVKDYLEYVSSITGFDIPEI